MTNVANFIDGAYLTKLCEQAGIGTPDLSLLPQCLPLFDCNPSTYYYDSLPHLSHSQDVSERTRYARKQRFFQRLQRSGFEVRVGSLAFRGRTASGQPIFVQKQVDVALGVDLAVAAVKGAITHASVVAGDLDFYHAFRVAREAGVHLTLYHGPETHRSLLTQCDRHVPIARHFFESLVPDGYFCAAQS